MSSVNSIVLFQNFFGLGPGGASKTGIVFGMYTIGQVCAFIPLSILPDLIGRKYSMFIGNICLM